LYGEAEAFMATVTVVPTDRPFPLIRLPKIRCHPFLSSLVFVGCDAVAISLAGITVLLENRINGKLDLHQYLSLWPALGIFFAIFALANLYPGIIHNAVTELRRLALALTLAFLVLAALIPVTRLNQAYPRRVLLLCWISAIVVTPLLRSIVRAFVCHKPWWGIPVAVFHTGDESTEIVRELELHPEIGLRPVVLLSSSYHGGRAPSVPIVDIHLAASVRACGVERAMIALPETGSAKLLEDLEKFESLFPRLMIIHSSAVLYSLTVNARPLAGCLAVEVRRDLLLPLPRLTKRSIDLFLVCLILPLVTLPLLLIGLLVRLESPGPIFYSQHRVGRDQRKFRIWKIRTMKTNADELLPEALAKDGKLREEWLRDRKLRHDPRITRVGKLLRKTSLDELPQLWNVLRGEMSLVGPRPIVEEEVSAYGQNIALYCRVAPGLTGLWQVSGRSAMSRRDRVRLDSYYVRNWSPWLDLHILACTASVVLTGEGAY
jgi:Undecaprenyl-phosphate galactose phosphotransferase WbaP